jgi:retinol dehydrogenase-13
MAAPSTAFSTEEATSSATSETLTSASVPRIVNVASFYASGLDLSDPEFKVRPYDNDQAYQQSKQANRMMTVAWAERLRNLAIVTSCHPGIATSSVSLGLGYDLDRSEQAQIEGSRTPLYCALAPSSSAIESGAYYANAKRTECEFSRDRTACERLFQILEAYP